MLDNFEFNNSFPPKNWLFYLNSGSLGMTSVIGSIGYGLWFDELVNEFFSQVNVPLGFNLLCVALY